MIASRYRILRFWHTARIHYGNETALAGFSAFGDGLTGKLSITAKVMICAMVVDLQARRLPEWTRGALSFCTAVSDHSDIAADDSTMLPSSNNMRNLASSQLMSDTELWIFPKSFRFSCILHFVLGILPPVGSILVRFNQFRLCITSVLDIINVKNTR